MICPNCRGRGFEPRMLSMDDDGPLMGPCEECDGQGVVSCCDTSGQFIEKFSTSVEQNINMPQQRFVCAACGAVQTDRMIICEVCNEPLVFPVETKAA